MENITIGQLVGAVGTISVLAGFFIGIYKLIKQVVLDKIEKNTKDIDRLEEEIKKIISRIEKLEEESSDSKEERLILLKGQLACLKGLKEQGCNGPVTKGIEDIEEYLVKKSHD